MTDRELLELAAKAAGIKVFFDDEGDCYRVKASGNRAYWNPLTDDGDALRLAVRLRLVCGFVDPNCWAELSGNYPHFEPSEPDPLAATRRAIVRAAAGIGKEMK